MEHTKGTPLTPFWYRQSFLNLFSLFYMTNSLFKTLCATLSPFMTFCYFWRVSWSRDQSLEYSLGFCTLNFGSRAFAFELWPQKYLTFCYTTGSVQVHKHFLLVFIDWRRCDITYQGKKMAGKVAVSRCKKILTNPGAIADVGNWDAGASLMRNWRQPTISKVTLHSSLNFERVFLQYLAETPQTFVIARPKNLNKDRRFMDALFYEEGILLAFSINDTCWNVRKNEFLPNLEELIALP